MTGGDLVLMSRRRASLSQRQLAERLGCRQATIARWERGDRSPSFEDVRDAIAACGLQLDAHLAVEDRSWWPQIALQLELEPAERVRRLTPPGNFDAVPVLGAIASAGVPAIIVGEIAGALHGWPLVLLDNTIELCARSAGTIEPLLDQLHANEIEDGVYEIVGGDRLLLTEEPAGTGGYGDLARGATAVEADGGAVQAAGLLDLLRIADASNVPAARREALAIQAVIGVMQAERARRRAGAVDHAPTDDERLEEWLSRHMAPDDRPSA